MGAATVDAAGSVTGLDAGGEASRGVPAVSLDAIADGCPLALPTVNG